MLEISCLLVLDDGLGLGVRKMLLSRGWVVVAMVADELHEMFNVGSEGFLTQLKVGVVGLDEAQVDPWC